MIFKIKKVKKRDGKIVDFSPDRIRLAIKKAMLSCGPLKNGMLDKIHEEVLRIMERKYPDDKEIPSVEDIQDIVEFVFIKFDMYEVAKKFIIYRKERHELREEKRKLLNKDYIDEVDKKFSFNSLRLLVTRYLRKNMKKEIIEDPKHMFKRIAALIVIPDIMYDLRIFDKEGKQQKFKKVYFDIEEYIERREDRDVAEQEIAPVPGLGLGNLQQDNNEKFEFCFNRWHIIRMKNLYDELNEKGQMKKDWDTIFNMLRAGEFENYVEKARDYYEVMVDKKFMPNSPTIFNSGTKLGQLSACFVIDIDDSIESIMDAARDAAMIFKSGGGIGMSYNKLRPEGDVVATTGGVASGPLSFLKIIDTMTDVIKQGGKRRGANMGILEIDHPDIEKFIMAKEVEFTYENFNFSVMIKENFWDHLKKKEQYHLINPNNKKIVKKVDPDYLIETISRMAWKSGDPGVVFKDMINKRNVLKNHLGEIYSTNPCGEEPLYPYESCNLGSINLYSFVIYDENDPLRIDFDWKEYERVIRIATRFLDNVIDMNKYPLDKIAEQTKLSRKIGLGLMGLADVLYSLKISYNSEDGFRFMAKVSECLTYFSMDESSNRAVERNAFPLYNFSGYKEGEMPIEGFYQPNKWNLPWNKLIEKIRFQKMRNAEVTTIAPTGSISMIIETPSSIEPQFALTYEKKVPAGDFYYADPEFEKQLKEAGLYNDTILKKISENGGSIQGIEEIPEEMRKVFVVSYDIPWWDHVRSQAEIGRWICAAVSKTINMPNWVTPDDVLKSYLFAYKLGLKGITIYRDGSKSVQVLITPSQKLGRNLSVVKNKTIDMMKELQIELPSDVKDYLRRDAKLDIFEKDGEKEEEEMQEIQPISPAIISNPIKKEKRDKCPNCDSKRLIYESSCVKCIDCNWSECLIS